jgi:hypothetical protein
LTSVTLPDSLQSIGSRTFPDNTGVCVDTDQPTATNLPWIPTCQMCASGEIVPRFANLDETATAATTATCELCPFPERCPGGGGCAQGAKGVGCSECWQGWFAFGGGCTECPEGAGVGLPIALVTAALVGIIVGVWKLSATPEAVEAADGARDNAETAAAIQAQVSNAVTFAGITAFHLQLAAINLSLPGFPFPGLLRSIARWVGTLFSFDIGTLANPECNAGDLPGVEILALKSVTFLGLIVAVMLALWAFGKYKGRRNHARNAMIAVYTLAVTALVKSSAQWYDCTDDANGMRTFDALPGTECFWYSQIISAVPGFFICAIVPLVLLWALRRRDTKVPCCFCCKRFDSPDKGEPFDYAASYDWVTRKYSPAHQSFETAFIGYKVMTAFTASEYSPHHPALRQVLSATSMCQAAGANAAARFDAHCVPRSHARPPQQRVEAAGAAHHLLPRLPRSDHQAEAFSRRRGSRRMDGGR